MDLTDIAQPLKTAIYLQKNQEHWLTIWYSGRDGFIDAEATATNRPHHVSTITMGTNIAVPRPDPDQALQLL